MSNIKVVKYKPTYNNDSNIFSESFEIDVDFNDVALTDEQLKYFVDSMKKVRNMAQDAYATTMPTGFHKASEVPPGKMDTPIINPITPGQLKFVRDLMKTHGDEITKYLDYVDKKSVEELNTREAYTIISKLSPPKR